jgi:hypothetical protein
MITREQINAANVPKLVAVPVAEWNCTVFVRQLCPSAVLALGESLKDKPRDESLALQLAAFLCDEAGTALYTAEQALTELVKQGLAPPTTHIMEVALRENGMGTPEDVKGNS